jgi:tyrosinase
MTAAHAGTTDTPTRYQRVREILQTAAGASKADYGGAGRFWEHGLAALKAAKVHDVSMIAPEIPSCCAEEPGAATSRGNNSGLIRGLRGEPPFDGSRFPPLLWGGARVSEDDIAFIADWIDDGCPAADHLTNYDLKAGSVLAEARVAVRDIAEFAPCAEGVNATVAREGAPRQRIDLDCMDAKQLDLLRRSFRRMYGLNDWPEDRRSYNNQALIHQNHCQHGWERFLPWHRAYLYEFEQNLQDFHADVMLPYWDFTAPLYRPDTPQCGSIIPAAFKAFLTTEAAEALIANLDPLPTATQKAALLELARQGALFTSQRTFFRYVIETVGYTDVTANVRDKNRQRFIDALLASNPLWYPLRYPAEYKGDGTIEQVIHYHYPSADDIGQILSLNNFRDFGGGNIYNASFGFLDQNPHNTMHIWTGGQNPNADGGSYARRRGADSGAASAVAALADRRNLAVRVGGRDFHKKSDMYTQPSLGDMFSNLTASYDPVFWPIHVNIDRLWWEWQKANPNGLPYDLDSILSPWSYTIRDTLDVSLFGYEYVRGSWFMPVGIQTPIGRFTSVPIQIGEPVKTFRKAEIRLHWVPQLVRSCFVRVFLNDPGANAATTLKGNPNFAGYLAIFGHGECYGGPGHCDLPPPRARSFDIRGRSHNTPRNHRIDVTEAAKRLLAAGSSLQITLVVIGADYQEDKELLKLEGVSLNFLD